MKIVKATIAEVDCLGAVGKVCPSPMVPAAHVLVRTPTGRYLTLPDSFVQSVKVGHAPGEIET